MSKPRRNYCAGCGASSDDVEISRKGRCPRCAQNALMSANQQIAQKSGPAYDSWALGMRYPRAPIGRPPTPHPPDA